MKNVKAVFFDLFNTLVYFSVNTNSYGQYFKAVHYDTYDRVTKRILLTENLKDFQAIADRFSITACVSCSYYDQLVKREIAQNKMFDDVIEALKYYRSQGFKIGIISNLATPYADPVYRFGFDKLVDALIFSFEVGFRKPDKQIFQIACDKVGVLPEEALMIGDSLKNDYEGAINFGMKALWLNRFNKDNETKAQYIKSLSEIKNYLK
jgi:HAD superfamily hydrolase (TIGR01549 family)